ncbi:hypothetical protein [Rhizobium sp. CF142]|uniref:hypothetical protein n=1 Tax=Rhizobium sp. CF142 TaxID=1144314 RepID=UPI00055FD431|nr:hypothetical protein [Rhizobium sp. CF142]
MPLPLEAQEAPYLAASERIANRSLSDFFIRMFSKCSRRQNQDEEVSIHPTSLQKQVLLRDAESFGKNFMEIARADLL